MRCIFCGFGDSKVVDSRLIDDPNSIRRRRECLSCGKRFTTYENVETTPILVIKKNGEREQFKIEKVKNGMIKACEKRPVALSEIERLSSDIEKKILASDEKEIKSIKIGKDYAYAEYLERSVPSSCFSRIFERSTDI